jgi:phospholipid N-methyltransferase
MNKFEFIKQFIKNPLSIGAVLPSSRFLNQQMIRGVCFLHAKVIVEYGPGTGVLTKLLIANRNPETLIILIEKNEFFYKCLNEKYKNEVNFFIHHGSASDIISCLHQFNLQEVDYIVSGLPFASLPEEVSHEILEASKKILKSKGKFITFQYSLFKKKLLTRYFSETTTKLIKRNLPPAFVIECGNKEMAKKTKSFGVYR